MNKNWKPPLIGAVGAGILSFLIGGIFKVGFPIILIRALLFAGISFLLVYLVLFLISKYLPELLSAQSSSDEFSQNSSAFGIEQNGEPGVEYDEQAEPSSEGIQGGRLSGEDITIELDGVDEGEVNQLDVVESGFESQEGEAALSSVTPSPGRGATSTEEFLGGNHDPEELAKSIRTVLKRDEKGSG